MIIITRTIVDFNVQIYLLLLFNKKYGVGNIVLPISDSQKCCWYFLFLLLDTSNTKNSFILLKNS